MLRPYYTGDGVLVGDGTTTSVQDLAAPLNQVLSDGTATYVYGHARLRALGGPWYVGDALGSVRQTLDDAGEVLATTSYDPWGTPQGTLSAPFGFTGELHHPGQVYLRARWYAPGQGRFVSEDPFAGWSERPYSLHAYQYASSDPVRWTDPTGEQPDRQIPKPPIVSRGEWGAREPTQQYTHICPFPTAIPIPGLCLAVPIGEGFYDPETNPEGYGCYSEMKHTRDKTLRENLGGVVIHHEGNTQTYDPKAVQQEHMSGKDHMVDVGYHFMVHPDGTIYEGRDIGARGFHVAGANTGMIGILWFGDFHPGPWWDRNTDKRPTQQQIDRTVQLIRWLDTEYGIDAVHAHRDINDTDCPGDNAMLFIPALDTVAKER